MRKLVSWIKALLFVALAAGIAVFIGYVVFANSVAKEAQRSRSVSPDTLPVADGVVVWTGPGGGRLQAGADILRAGKGERLLISGVNGANDRETVLGVLELPDELADCCVDLDYAAIDTDTNAQETWAWVDALGYEHVILVTSAYHMPRAKVALGTRAGRIRVTAYPVASDSYDEWWKDPELRERLAREYGKLLVSYFRDPAPEPTRETPIIEIEGTN